MRLITKGQMMQVCVNVEGAHCPYMQCSGNCSIWHGTDERLDWTVLLNRWCKFYHHFQVYTHGVSQSRLVLLSRRVSGIGPVSSLSGIPAWVRGLGVIGMSNGCWAGTGTQPPLIIPTRCKPEHQLHWFTAALGSGLNINNAWSSASHLPCGHWPAITRREHFSLTLFIIWSVSNNSPRLDPKW